MSYFYILCTIALTVYGPLAIRRQVSKAVALPEEMAERIWFLRRKLVTLWVISAVMAALLASLTLITAMTKLQSSHACPFMNVAFILAMILIGLLFNEPITSPKIAGVNFPLGGSLPIIARKGL